MADLTSADRRILWRAWRSCDELEFAQHLIRIVGDQPSRLARTVSIVTVSLVGGSLGGTLGAGLGWAVAAAVGPPLGAVGALAGAIAGARLAAAGRLVPADRAGPALWTLRTRAASLLFASTTALLATGFVLGGESGFLCPGLFTLGVASGDPGRSDEEGAREGARGLGASCAVSLVAGDRRSGGDRGRARSRERGPRGALRSAGRAQSRPGGVGAPRRPRLAQLDPATGRGPVAPGGRGRGDGRGRPRPRRHRSGRRGPGRGLGPVAAGAPRARVAGPDRRRRSGSPLRAMPDPLRHRRGRAGADSRDRSRRVSELLRKRGPDPSPRSRRRGARRRAAGRSLGRG